MNKIKLILWILLFIFLPYVAVGIFIYKKIYKKEKNNKVFSIFISIFIGFLTFMFLTEFIFYEKNNPVKIIEPVKTIEIVKTIEPIITPEIENIEKKEFIEYNEWASIEIIKISILFDKISIDCASNNFLALEEDFNLLKQAGKEFDEKNCPIELYDFKKAMIKMFFEWDNAYIALLDNDVSAVSRHIENALGYMDEAINTYNQIQKKYINMV